MVTSLLKSEVFMLSSFFISHRGQFKFKFGGVDIQLCLMLVSAMFIQFFFFFLLRDTKSELAFVWV
jgi:hypothetical protein